MGGISYRLYHYIQDLLMAERNTGEVFGLTDWDGLGWVACPWFFTVFCLVRRRSVNLMSVCVPSVSSRFVLPRTNGRRRTKFFFTYSRYNLNKKAIKKSLKGTLSLSSYNRKNSHNEDRFMSGIILDLTITAHRADSKLLCVEKKKNCGTL